MTLAEVKPLNKQYLLIFHSSVERNQTLTNASPSLSPGPSTCPCSGAEGASRTRTRPSGCGPPPCVAARVHAACSPRACARRGLSELMAVLDVGPELTRLWCHSRQAVEELVKQRDDLQQASTALQKVIDDQKQVHRA